MPAIRRAVAMGLAVALTLVGCGKSGEEERAAFCDDAGELGQIVDPYRNISGAAGPEELRQLFDTSVEHFTQLAEDAPGDIADDFEILVEGIEEYRGVMEEGGYDATAIDQERFVELEQQYRPSSDAVNTWLKRCDIDTGAGGPATTAAPSTTG